MWPMWTPCGQIYDTYEQEAHRCLEAGLVVPAHDYNLKCSHLFNILDTRGAVGRDGTG